MTITEAEMFDDQYLVIGDLVGDYYQVLEWSGSKMKSLVGSNATVNKKLVDALIKEGFQVEFA